MRSPSVTLDKSLSEHRFASISLRRKNECIQADVLLRIGLLFVVNRCRCHMLQVHQKERTSKLPNAVKAARPLRTLSPPFVPTGPLLLSQSPYLHGFEFRSVNPNSVHEDGQLSG